MLDEQNKVLHFLHFAKSCFERIFRPKAPKFYFSITQPEHNREAPDTLADCVKMRRFDNLCRNRPICLKPFELSIVEVAADVADEKARFA